MLLKYKNNLLNEMIFPSYGGGITWVKTKACFSTGVGCWVTNVRIRGIGVAENFPSHNHTLAEASSKKFFKKF